MNALTPPCRLLMLSRSTQESAYAWFDEMSERWSFRRRRLLVRSRDDLDQRSLQYRAARL